MKVKASRWFAIPGIVALQLLIFSLPPVTAQEVIYFAMEGDGTASVVVDTVGQTANIIDGGRSGRYGIVGARIEGQDVLDHLTSRGIKSLTVTCSHPHADHMGGLEALVTDKRILGFETSFVDAAYTEATGKKSLYTIYMERWKGRANTGKPPYSSAKGQNAFATLLRPKGGVAISNHVYSPATIGSTAHDNSVVTQYTIGTPPQGTHVVDFDDASTALVNDWAGKEGARVNVLVYPHHGSRYNKVEPILKRKDELGLRDVVISVNRNNRFRHPAPEVLLRLLQEMRPEHVYLTDSEIGSNVRIGTAGVIAGTDTTKNRNRLANFIRARIEHNLARIMQRAEVVLNDAVLEEDAAVQRYQKDIQNLQASLVLLGEAEVKYPAIVVRGAGRGFGKEAEGPIGSPPPPMPRSGHVEYMEKVAEQQQKDRSGAGGGAPPTSGGGGPGGIDRELSRYPTWGGVIVGNRTSGEVLRSVEFLRPQSSDDSLDTQDESVVLRVTAKDGRVGDYTAVTMTELWTAHRFVQPTIDIAGSDSNVIALQGAIGLVGLVGKTRSGAWRFAIAPAIANTIIAEDAMRVDMLIAAANATDLDIEKPPHIQSVTWPTGYRTYQWYDERSSVSIADGIVQIRAGSDPGTCLMRVRIVSPSLAVIEEVTRQVKQEFEERARGLSESEMVELAKELGRKGAAQLDSQSTSEPGLLSSLDQLCHENDALATIDRFARIVAILNRYRASTKNPLPALPEWIRPSKRQVDAEWPLERVFLAANVVNEASVVSDTTVLTDTNGVDVTKVAVEPEGSDGTGWRRYLLWGTGAIVLILLLVRVVRARRAA